MEVLKTFTNPYSPYLLASTLVASIMAVITWRRRSAPGALPLFLMLITTILWSGAGVLINEAVNSESRYYWFNFLLFGSLMGTPAFWAFGVQYTGRDHWLTRRNILLVSIIPILSVLLGWTARYHDLFYKVFDFGTRLPNGQWNLVPGIMYWVYVAYSYSVMIFTVGILAQAFSQSAGEYRSQAGVILAGTLIPFIGNIVYTFLFGMGNGGIDPTPLLFTVMGVFYAYGLFRHRLFDMAPIARHMLIETMQDGVILIDARNRVVDVNPSALRWLGWNQHSPIGRDMEEILGDWYNQITIFPADLYIETEVHTTDKPERYFDLRVEPLTDKKQMMTGRLIVFRDITRQKMAEKAFRDAHDRMRLHLKEIELLQEELREQSIRDPLTGLFNRRYLEETFERELARAIREETTLSVCMADIDNFKSFNDRHGHKAGDLVLKTLAEIFTTHSRAADVVCRYGGEEFLILMPGADLDTTARRAEDWRSIFEQSRIEFDGEILSTTLSLGVAVFPHQGRTSDEVIKLADEALYLSKHGGKNKVSVARPWANNPM
ncbi:MAG: diguanylate cyclase [Chloroflexi bacterium CFX2]|nr:diguanylate cyclase [Chloroflexi bacterium CFX2]